MLTKGDKLVVVKKVASFLDEGDIAKVVDVNDNGIAFAFGDEFVHMGFMSPSEFEEHFKKMEAEKTAPSIAAEHIEEIIEMSEIEVFTVFDKCTIVACKLPNGFVIVESSACVSPENYDENLGFDICLDKIVDKVWELEGYELQDKLYRETLCEEYNNCDCHCCDSFSCDHSCIEEEFDECLDTDLDCDECEAFNCPYNINR